MSGRASAPWCWGLVCPRVATRWRRIRRVRRKSALGAARAGRRRAHEESGRQVRGNGGGKGETATATIPLEGENPPVFFNAKIEED